MLKAMPKLGMPSASRSQPRRMTKVTLQDKAPNQGPQVNATGTYTLGATYGVGGALFDYRVGNVSTIFGDKNGRIFADRFQTNNPGSGPTRLDFNSGNGNSSLYCASGGQLIFGTISNQNNGPNTMMTLTNVSSTPSLRPNTSGTGNLGDSTLAWGQLQLDYTNTAPGTTGNQTINKASGRVNIAAAGSTVTVTSSKCTANSEVFAVCATNDSTAYVKNVVPAAGSFVITLGAATTAETAIAWWILNQ